MRRIVPFACCALLLLTSCRSWDRKYGCDWTYKAKHLPTTPYRIVVKAKGATKEDRLNFERFATIVVNVPPPSPHGGATREWLQDNIGCGLDETTILRVTLRGTNDPRIARMTVKLFKLGDP